MGLRALSTCLKKVVGSDLEPTIDVGSDLEPKIAERIDVRGAHVVAAHMDITIEIQVDRDLLEMYRQSFHNQ